MRYYAKVVDGIVTNVIVADIEFFNSFIDDSPGEWIEYTKDSSLRKNPAGIGSTYDSARDAFISLKPHNSWTLNEDTCKWESPVTYPDDDKRYTWNEGTTSWDERPE